MKKRIIYGLFLLSVSTAFAQIEVLQKGVLPTILNENSGLVFYGNKLITHNDSGNDAVLFEIDTLSLEVSRSVTVLNAENMDWEDIAQDDQYIYIGDIGNNLGTRTDLGIYRISKQEYDQTESVVAERIQFTYEDQTDFSDQGNSDWDAEALFVLDGQLIILTKQWKKLGTVAYALSNSPGNHVAVKIGEFDINGLVTGACYNKDTNELLILGYSPILEPFVHIVSEPNVQNIFQGESQKVDASFGFSQTEGIALVSNNRFFISSERFSRENPSITLSSQLVVLQLPTNSEEINEAQEGEDEGGEEDGNGELIEEEKDYQLSIFPSQDNDTMAYELNTQQNVLARALFDVTGKMVHFEVPSEFNGNSIGVTSLNTGIYFLAVYLGDRVISKPFLRK